MLALFGIRMNNLKFSILANQKKARAGEISTHHGIIKTPVFMPVGTIGSVKAIFPQELKNLDIDIILANTYHLMQRPGDKLINRMGGLQNFINWEKPILTDSGGFQVWSLSKLKKISKDGIKYQNLSLVHGEVPLKRYWGIEKRPGPQYVRGILEGNGNPPGDDIWVVYSVSKEDIWISKIPFPILERIWDLFSIPTCCHSF